MCLLEDKQKNIWIGTDNGLNRITVSSDARLAAKVTPYL